MHTNTSQLFWGILLIAVGVLFLLEQRGTVDAVYILTNYWPLILVVLGLLMIFGTSRKKSEPVIGASAEPAEKSPGPQRVRNDLRNMEHVYESNVFGDIRLVVASNNFRGGSVTTVFGDISVDLHAAVIAEGQQEFNISGVFGDVDIDIPPDVPINVTGSTLFGDIRVREERRSGIARQLAYRSENYDRSARKLKIHFNQVFGDVSIR
jgi:predicted membrane protein